MTPQERKALFVTHTKELNSLNVSIRALQFWAEHAHEKSNGIFLASKTFLSVPSPPMSCGELQDIAFWNANCQMRTIDTGRYMSFRFPDTIYVTIIPQLDDSSNVLSKVMQHTVTMTTILSNRYEKESIFSIIAVNLPMKLMRVVIDRATLKYQVMLPDAYPCKPDKEVHIIPEADLTDLKRERRKIIKELSDDDVEREKIKWMYRDFRDRLHEIRSGFDLPFVICFSIVDAQSTIIWFRQREQPELLQYLPGLSTGKLENARTVFWPRFDHPPAVRLPLIYCNSNGCHKNRGECDDIDVMITFVDYQYRGQSEHEKETADLMICSRCKKAQYCSAECQRADYKRHKIVCIRSN
ncbi:9639_t:CDS:1 [Paraglomus occultum]|uniref:9639_t:CDS:1 n=1 Tax=Paraglomus occultum TaxID=144539 RepID=A0A9N8W4B0_9GLOM|nr:9639_t:CDS:1 [Paraglomus occultum]